MYSFIESLGKNYVRIDSDSEKLSDASPGSVGSADLADELSGLSFEEQEKLRAEWSQELARVEEEITTLRTVLQAKMRNAAELKRKLGITVWKEISDDVNQGIKNVKESNAYQKTESVLKTTAEKTSNIFGGLTSGISTKFNQMKKSDSYRSIEGKVGNAYESVKTKVASRSTSVNSLNEGDVDSRNSSVPQSPKIPEGKPIS